MVGVVAGVVAAAAWVVPATATAQVPEKAQLTTDPAPGQGFGGAVATAGDLVVVGDASEETVDVYERPADGWSGEPDPIATLFRPDLPAGSRFGESVATSDDGSLIVVGAPGVDGPSRPDFGRVYAYKRPVGGWAGNPEPYTPPGAGQDYYRDDFLMNQPAWDTDPEQGLRVVAAPDGSWLGLLSRRHLRPDISQLETGYPAMVSIYQVEGLSPSRRLYLGRGNAGTIASLATNDDGTTIFAGMPIEFGNTGYVVAWNDPSGDWSGGGFQPHEGELAAPIVIGQPGRTGVSLAAEGDFVVAGAPRATVGGASQAGLAYVWEKPSGGWNHLSAPVGGQPYPGIMPVATLRASDPAAAARFGQSAGIFGDAIGVAAPGATVDGETSQGKAYVFREPVGGWSGEIDEEVAQFAASDGAAGDELGSYDTYPGGLNDFPPAGQELAVSQNTLFASAPEQGNPAYAFEFKPELVVETTGGGSGTVTGGTINCPGICSAREWLGDTVTLTANPSPGSQFIGWSGGGCGGNGTCEVTMDGAQQVTAQFSGLPPGIANLTVTVDGQGGVSGGGIDCPGTCSAVMPAGSTANLTATPAQGWTFAGWDGAGCSGTGGCAVTMSGDRAVRATFAEDSPPPGGGEDPPPGGGEDPPTPPGGNAAPETTINATSIRAGKGRAKFSFSGTGGTGALEFECSLVKRGANPRFSTCISSKSYKDLKKGHRTFSVRARDASGAVDETPATKTFKIKRKR